MKILIPFNHYAQLFPHKNTALYRALRESIVEGRLESGSKLPSSRELAEIYGISRGLVMQVYEMLMSEGYIEGKPGKGTFVAYRSDQAAGTGSSSDEPLLMSAWGRFLMESGDGAGRREEGSGGSAGNKEGSEEQELPGVERRPGRVKAAEVDATGQGQIGGAKQAEAGTAGYGEGIGAGVAEGSTATSDTRTAGPNAALASPHASRSAGSWPPEPHTPAGPGAVVFELSGTDSAAFPRQAWNRCLHEQVRSAAFLEDPLRDPQGDYSLRSAIALHLRRSRSIDADPDCVAIVNGSMQAIALTMQLLVNPGDEVVVESPGYSGAVRAAAAAGGVPVDAPVDGQGIIPQPWNARLLFVTPGRQFPTGAVLPLKRRQELLRWAKERGAVIIEDDYDTEFRYAGRPLEPLKALDREGRVLFVGTFSRTMYAGLRLGYAVLPPSLVEPFRRAKQHYEPLTTGMMEQRALAAFMNSGAYERHLRRMQRVYGEKAALLRSGLTALDPAFEWMPSEAGLHIFGWWKGGAEDYRRFAAECAKRGVFWRDAGRHVRCEERPAACFGFGHLSREEIGRGIAVMTEVLTETFL
ncbi:aminotransferase class I/II-fold pyridoxal phosphate-dependent enzyme [Paenibacillus chitinolyticus]|uniref:aminotransferase class I/II-fold pyridoxal phosphate-dependent enzyme n=1 Tax=Paenibacillus chitinolyticus TaxID=79263 RepID=UPI0036DBA79F